MGDRKGADACMERKELMRIDCKKEEPLTRVQFFSGSTKVVLHMTILHETWQKYKAANAEKVRNLWLLRRRKALLRSDLS